MRILLIDIETAPNTAFVWGIFKENIPLARLIESGYVMCYSAKWLGEDDIYFDSVNNSDTIDMLQGIHSLMDEADAIVHYNGNKFDIPTLHREFLIAGFNPPAPSKHIDLYQTVKKNFKFLSNKLDYVAQQLDLGQKKDTTFELWIGCMNFDEDSWKKMEEYNIQDVVLLEQVYYKLRPWIKGINHGLYNTTTSLVCPNCGSNHYHSRGSAVTSTCTYNRYQCQECGHWFRSTKNIGPKAGEKFVSV